MKIICIINYCKRYTLSTVGYIMQVTRFKIIYYCIQNMIKKYIIAINIFNYTKTYTKLYKTVFYMPISIIVN